MHWRQERLDTKYGREVRINQMRPLLSSVLIFSITIGGKIAKIL